MKIWQVPGKWIWNVLVTLDQAGNVLAGGDPDETISSRIGRIKVANGGRVPWRRPVAKALGAVLDRVDEDHCRKNIESDEGGKGVVDRPERQKTEDLQTEDRSRSLEE